MKQESRKGWKPHSAPIPYKNRSNPMRERDPETLPISEFWCKIGYKILPLSAIFITKSLLAITSTRKPTLLPLCQSKTKPENHPLFFGSKAVSLVIPNWQSPSLQSSLPPSQSEVGSQRSVERHSEVQKTGLIREFETEGINPFRQIP